MIIGFPSNPTAKCVELDFFEKVIALARQHGILVVHDLAYADITFDGWKAPSIMQVPGARDVAVEFFTMSKSYNMAGWRIGFMVGNTDLVNALARIKSYHDYGTFTPLQVAAIAALEGPQECVEEIRAQVPEAPRRDGEGPARGGLDGREPEGLDVRLGADSRAVPRRWARSSSPRSCCADAKVAVSPGIGFGDYGDDHVRIALIENEARIAPGGARRQGDVPQGRREVKVVAVSDAKGAVTDAPLLRAAERVHRQLRPHLRADYVGRMKEVLAGGAEMAVALVDGEVAGITVFRVLEKTHSGRDLYCDDLVTDEARRSTGVGPRADRLHGAHLPRARLRHVLARFGHASASRRTSSISARG